MTQCLILHLSQETGSTPSPTERPRRRNRRTPAGSTALRTRANNAFAAGDYAQAADLYGELAERDPRRPDVLNTLGVCSVQTCTVIKRRSSATARPSKSIPEFVEALCNLASVLQGDPQEAEAILRRALRVNPKHRVLAPCSAGLLLFHGARTRGRAAFRKALKIAPTESDALLGLAQIARTDGRLRRSRVLDQTRTRNQAENPDCLGGAEQHPQDDCCRRRLARGSARRSQTAESRSGRRPNCALPSASITMMSRISHELLRTTVAPTNC